MRRVVHGIKRLVFLQLQEVTWRCSNTHMRTDALGMKRLVILQLKEVTWRCSNTHMRMDAGGMLKEFAILQVSFRTWKLLNT